MLNYRIINEKENYEDGSFVYVAYCPTLGISDYGDTVEEVLASIKDGIEIPNEYTLSIMKRAEKNYKKGNTSPAFDNAKDMEKWFDKQGI